MNFNEVVSLKWIYERQGAREYVLSIYNRATVERWRNFTQYQLIACTWADRKQRTVDDNHARRMHETGMMVR